METGSEVNSAVKDIVILDNVIIGNNHLVINSSMIEVFQNLLEDPNESQIRFYGENSHMNALSSILERQGSSLPQFNAVDVVPLSGSVPKRSFAWLRKLKKDASEFHRVLAKVNEIQPAIFLITTMIPMNMLRFLKKMNACKSGLVLILLHGELEYIFKENPTAGEKIKSYLFRKILKNAGENIQFLVLSDYIKEALAGRQFIRKDRLISINHPLLEYTREHLEMDGPVVFSHLGVANNRKNSALIFDLAEKSHQSLSGQSAQFNVIGRVDLNEMQYQKNDFVEIKSESNKSISQEEYISFIETSHYSLIFLDSSEYVYRISGSVLDSVQYQLPLVALEHPFVNELFEKGGDIGFLCKDFEEMTRVVLKLSQKDPSYTGRYETQIANLKKLSEKFYAENVSGTISKAIKS